MTTRRAFVRKSLDSLLCTGGVALLSAASLAATPSAPPDPESPAVALQTVSVPETGIREEAALLLVGTAMIGIAAAVRRAA